MCIRASRQGTIDIFHPGTSLILEPPVVIASCKRSVSRHFKRLLLGIDSIKLLHRYSDSAVLLYRLAMLF